MTAAFLALASPAWGETSAHPPPDSPPSPDQQRRLDDAKELYRKGQALLDVGDCERALEFFLKSREAFPSVYNTNNAAFCLDELDRDDEALEMYESLIAEFDTALEAAERDTVGAHMKALRQTLGALEVGANVPAILVVDRRRRGTLPLNHAIRVVPGHHKVQLVLDGYGPFERAVDVTSGGRERIDAVLEPLGGRTLLHVEGPELTGASVVIDGVAVGTMPWEGALSSGDHVVQVVGADLGTRPTVVRIVGGRTVSMTAKPERLGAETKIEIQPHTASLTLDGVPVGTGAWHGRLPLGRHDVEVQEAGYVTTRQALSVAAEAGAPVRVQLAVDPGHPRWATGKVARFSLEAFGGFAFGATLGSGAEESCGGTVFTCTSRSGPKGLSPPGYIVGLRGGYELPSGFAIEIEAGYLRVGATVAREHGETIDGLDGLYTFQDHLVAGGLLLGPSAAFRTSGRFGIGGRVVLGVWLPAASDSIDGRLAAAGSNLTAVRNTSTEGSGSSKVAAELTVLPEVFAILKLGNVRVGAGLTLMLSLLDGPFLATDHTQVTRRAACDQAAPTASADKAVDCAETKRLVAGEKAFGRMMFWIPGAHVAYVF